MATTQAFIEALCQSYPEDAEDLHDALEVFRQQRLNSCERLLRLNDAYWQRLGLPLGIESLLRDELAAAAPPAAAAAATPAVGSTAAPASSTPARQATVQSAAASRHAAAAPAARRGPARHAATPPTDNGSSSAEEGSDDGAIPLQPFEPANGLYQRGSGGRKAARPQAAEDSVVYSRLRQGAQGNDGQEQGFLGPLELTPPPNLEELWMSLLEDTLPADRHPALQATWDSTPDPNERYMMLLEYSSYLRKPELTEEEKAERKREMEPFMREFGLNADGEEEGGCPSFVLWTLLIGMLLFAGGTSYYYYHWPDLAHDFQAL